MEEEKLRAELKKLLNAVNLLPEKFKEDVNFQLVDNNYSHSELQAFLTK